MPDEKCTNIICIEIFDLIPAVKPTLEELPEQTKNENISHQIMQRISKYRNFISSVLKD
jgi:hypothetical protein